MVKLWLMHSGEISLPEQIATQMRLAVLSSELQPGERLPSVRALARRLALHHNTVSAAYRRLEQEGWVTMRRGSGVYVRDRTNTDTEADARQAGVRSLDEAIAGLAEFARSLGVDAEQLQRRIALATTRRRAERILLVEPEPELREIVLAELRDANLGFALTACGFEELTEAATDGALVVALPSKVERVRAALPHFKIVTLKIRSAADSLSAHLPASNTGLIGLASHWPQFLEIGRTMLLAAGLDPEALVVRDARETGWRAGLGQTAAVVCDSFTLHHLGAGVKPLPFTLLAAESVEELKNIAIPDGGTA
jgi:DNA-binding transcriptional regulator YhcF (GntR family)